MRRMIIVRNGARAFRGRGGAVLIIALLTLAMVTVMGVFSATRSALELQIANHMENQVVAFFAAEAGISHGQKILTTEFIKYNEKNLSAVPAMVPYTKLTWNFILDGTYTGVAAGAIWCGDYPVGADNDCVHGASRFDGPWTNYGVQVAKRSFVQGAKTIEYTVTVWDDVDFMFYGGASFAGDDYLGADASIPKGSTCGNSTQTADVCWGFSPTVDEDGIIYARSVGRVLVAGVEVASAVHELLFAGEVTGKGAVVPGLAQEFANEGHSSSGMDLTEIDVNDLTTGGTI